MKPSAAATTEIFLRGPILLLVIWICSFTTPAATTEAYKTKVESLRRLAIEAEWSLRDNETSTAEVKAFADQIRRDFPASERIESAGGAVETSNGWLLERAGSLDSESDQAKKQLLTVVEIREYLSSVAFKLDEPTTDLEYRLFVQKGVRLVLERINLESTRLMGEQTR